MPRLSRPKAIDTAINALRERKFRVTAPRRAILQILIDEHGPFSIEELHDRMADGSCDLVTVYRSLSAMEEAGLVRRCDFGDNVQRFEFNTGSHHHHHLVCRSCGSVQILDLCVVDALERIARDRGYANITHVLELFGTCPGCQREAQR